MALFNKLFFSSSSKRKTLNSNQHQHYLSQFPFETNQVRILLFRECDNRGRRLLFDSSALQKTSTKENATFSTLSENASSFDEKSKCKGFTSNSKTYIRISDEFLYQHSRPTADISNIGEMIFGALAMSFRGTSLKVHWLQSPIRILCSQVFLSPINSTCSVKQLKENSGQSLSENYLTENNSVNSLSMPFSVSINKHLSQLADAPDTVPLDVPDTEPHADNVPRYSIFSGGDSGYAGTDIWATSVSSCYHYSTRSSFGSVLDDQENLRKLSIDSNSGENYYSSNIASNKQSSESFQRRILRNMSTSFENRTSKSDFIGYIDDNCEAVTNGGSEGCVTRFQKLVTSKETYSNPEMVRQRRASGETSLSVSGRNRHFIKRAKLGLAVCITMTEKHESEMAEFCCEHIALLESMLSRLRASVENAYINHRNFLQIMLHAWQVAAYWLTDLFTAPRLPCPIWTSLGTFDNKKSKIAADYFMKELCWLLSFADTKDTNFFISKVLTAVLTNHLGWVTIISSEKSTAQPREADVTEKSTLQEVAEKHPYNALWAQIGDLYGAIGSPPKISRTIVYGKEKLSLERLLNMLTYFIRCGEIRKMPKSEVMDQASFKDIIQKQEENNEKSNIKQTQKSGLVRSRTYVAKLGDITCQENLNFQNESSDDGIAKSILKDIPNVITLNDSPIIQPRLTLPEHVIDTEHEKHVIERKSNIVLSVTNPDNVEIPVNVKCDVPEADVVEATELQMPFIKEKGKSFSLKGFSWNIGAVKEGLSWEALLKLQNGIKVINDKIRETNFMQKSKTTAEDIIYDDTKLELKCQGNVRKQTNLSDLVTANNVGQGERFTWGVKSTKETVSEEKETHFELGKNIIEQKKISQENNSGVVFVLGDNEALVNIKKSNENLSEVNKKVTQPTLQRICSHHKKHSGVKFNFEQYPQIATNYMKNKNLELSNYDFFEKSSKFEEMFKYGPSTSSLAVELPKAESNSCEECEYCSGTRTLQTPSNATELEFETNDSYSVPSPTFKDLNSSTSRQNVTDPKNENSCVEKSDLKFNDAKHSKSFERKTKSDIISIIQVPVPSILDDMKNKEEYELRSGFIPSLLIGVTDRYISDMVLQGTLSPPRAWEVDLKQDLVLASRCALFTSAPAENVAIIADMEKWDVKIISSQTHSLPSIGSISSSVGMSQLVSTMLETVQAMNNSGISSCECLSYIESKLQEMYLQSEVLAAFLLATEFCSLNTLTSTLNLSVNDVPLLISVASIHSPQVTKKYGVSFR